MSFRDSSEPGGGAIRQYACDICGLKKPASMHNEKCGCGGGGYYKIPVFESD